MDSCHLSITVIQNQIIIVGSPVLWVCFLSIPPSSFRLFNLPTLVLQIRQLPFAFLVDLEINLFSFLKSWWNFSTCFKGIVWFHSSAHVRAMTLARSILLFMKQSEASWCLKREIFVVSRENAVIEVMFHYNFVSIFWLPCTIQFHYLWTNLMRVQNLCACLEEIH